MSLWGNGRFWRRLGAFTTDLVSLKEMVSAWSWGKLWEMGSLEGAGSFAMALWDTVGGNIILRAFRGPEAAYTHPFLS